MPKPNIPYPQPVGGAGKLWHLPQAIEAHPNNKLVLYCRVSSRPQQANGGLDRQLVAEREDLSTIGDVLFEYAGVEAGQIQGDRPKLQLAIYAARKHKAILVASDRSRLIRSQAYDRNSNSRNVEPTPAEWAMLFDKAHGVVLATRQPPDLPEHERAIYLTKKP